ncbi:MAG: tetratricopeptide repeat protein, partial [Flammeovirgaceae bacterium]
MNTEFQKRQRSYERGKQSLLLFFVLSYGLVCSQSTTDKAFIKAKEEWLTANSFAEESFKTLIMSTSDPEILAQSYYYLGDVYHARGDFREAVENNKKVLGFRLPSGILKHANLNGDHLKHLACSTLADLYLSLENFDEALVYLKLET